MGHLSGTPDMKLCLLSLLAGLALTEAGTSNAVEWLLDDLFEDAQYDKNAIPMESGPTKDNGDGRPGEPQDERLVEGLLEGLQTDLGAGPVRGSGSSGAAWRHDLET